MSVFYISRGVPVSFFTTGETQELYWRALAGPAAWGWGCFLRMLCSPAAPSHGVGVGVTENKCGGESSAVSPT